MARRHRIFQDEISFIVKAIAEVVETKSLNELKQGEVRALFNFLWRIKEHRTGPPSYPEIDGCVVSRLLEDVRRIFNFA